MADAVTNNYVVGRGRLFFGKFLAGTRIAAGQDYLGNTPALSVSQSEETLDHYSSEGGIKVKDASVTLQNDSSGSFTCDDISTKNLALWFRGITSERIEAGSARATGTLIILTAVPVTGDKFTVAGHDIVFSTTPTANQVLIGGSITATALNLQNYINSTPSLGVTSIASVGTNTLTAIGSGTEANAITLTKTFATGANASVSGATLTGGTDVTENFADVLLGTWLQLGVTDDLPQGVRGVNGVNITGVADDSFVVEESTGRIYLNLDAADIDNGQDLVVTYGVNPVVESVVISRGDNIEGSLTFIANNAVGINNDYFWPYVRLTPDGDLQLKGDDWQQMVFNFEILKISTTKERQYITARPAGAPY